VESGDRLDSRREGAERNERLGAGAGLREKIYICIVKYTLKFKRERRGKQK